MASPFFLSLSLFILVGFCCGPAGPVAACGCSCLVVIRSSHCTSAPSHYKEGQWDTLCPFLSPSPYFCFCLSLYIPVLSPEKCQCSGQRQRQTGIHPCLLTLNINNITQPRLVAFSDAVILEKGNAGHTQFRSNIHSMSNIHLKGEVTSFVMFIDLIMKKVCISPRLSS